MKIVTEKCVDYIAECAKKILTKDKVEALMSGRGTVQVVTVPITRFAFLRLTLSPDMKDITRKDKLIQAEINNINLHTVRGVTNGRRYFRHDYESLIHAADVINDDYTVNWESFKNLIEPEVSDTIAMDINREDDEYPFQCRIHVEVNTDVDFDKQRVVDELNKINGTNIPIEMFDFDDDATDETSYHPYTDCVLVVTDKNICVVETNAAIRYVAKNDRLCYIFGEHKNPFNLVMPR